MGGKFRQRFRNDRFDGFPTIEYVAIPEPENGEPPAFKPVQPLSIVNEMIRFGVLSAVELQNQFFLKADEVREIPPERKPAAKLVAVELTFPKSIPSESLGVRHFLAEFSCEISAFHACEPQ